MKREQRRPWLQNGSGWLCAFCRYAECENWAHYDGDPEYEWHCRHPVDKIVDDFDAGDIDIGVDCWGFQPKKGARCPETREAV